MKVSKNFRVEGMTAHGSILWSGWPDDIRSALEEREDVYTVHFDTATRIFGISFDDESVSMTDLAEAVESLGQRTNRPYKFIEVNF